MDFAAYLGIALGIGAIIVGNVLEGGTIFHLLQPSAALIVFGGTLGATLLSFSWEDVTGAVRALGKAFRTLPSSPEEVIETVIDLLTKTRKGGVLALEPEIGKAPDPFLRKGLTLLLDGMDAATIRAVLGQEMSTYETTMKRAARVFEAAGGYAPTIGILGAVLGLIQVMRNVTDPTMIGQGIAVAFVATIYGVGSANLIFLPLSKKIINRVNEEVFLMELVLEGVLGIEGGVNPFVLRTKLESFLAEHRKGKR
ncbi:MAG: flagellar motor protein [Deltaproteobacteria bacterium]|nr:MAG: flagellar motor protein [Deltaproteobacteria bacterium]